MYSHFLFVHSWLRWIIIFLLCFVIVKFFISLKSQKIYTKLDRILSSVLLGFVHLQFLLGLILYFGLSQLVKVGLADMKITMKNNVLRYWTVEHIFTMFLFVILIQCGFSLSKRATDDGKKHRYMLSFSFFAFVLLILTIPWPIREFGRTLFNFKY